MGSYNRKSRGLRWETADQWEKRIVGSRWVKTADRLKKSIVGSRWVKTTDQWKKSIVGSRWVKPAEKTRAQSPKSKLGKRGGPLKTTPNKKKIKDILLNLFLQ